MTGNMVSEGSVTIANGATTSGVQNCINGALIGIVMPAAFTGTSISLTASSSATGTFTPVYNSSGIQVAIQVGTSRTILFSPTDFIGLKYVKLVSNGAEAADRSIICILRAL